MSRRRAIVEAIHLRLAASDGMIDGQRFSLLASSDGKSNNYKSCSTAATLALYKQASRGFRSISTAWDREMDGPGCVNSWLCIPLWPVLQFARFEGRIVGAQSSRV